MIVADLTWPGVLTGLIRGEDLDTPTAQWAMDQVLSGNATPVQIAGFAVALRAKGETVDEIAGLSEGMLAHAVPLDLNRDAVDVVGSGGDRANTVNISTMAAIVAAAAGATVVKHGNRAASSMCGTADCLEALGVALEVPPHRQAGVLADVGITFLFAPLYHQSLRHAAAARRELGVQTTFNFLGPLSNPARPLAQAIGVANPTMAPLMAGVLARRGTRGLVFHGTDGLDELTTTTSSTVWMFTGGVVVDDSVDPAALGIAPARLDELVGGPPAHNAQVVRDTLGGQPGAVRDIVLLNAAAALLAHDGPDLNRPVTEQLEGALARAAEAVDSGAGTDLLERWSARTWAAVEA